MKCPKCQFEDRDEAKFCGECGHKFEITCPVCGTDNRVGNKFCDECGPNLKPVKEVSDLITEDKSPPVFPAKDITGADTSAVKCERKHITVLFSDLSGYTAITERLDPEDVKEIMSRIFAEIVQIVNKYEGFIERFVGDAVMALFGVPIVHEDDAVRAIRVAREIHDTIEYISPQFEKRVGQKLTMHTGINTGLAVTGEVNLEKGTHGVTGDAVNLAARLNGIASAGEIIVGPETFRQAEGFFTFEILEPTKVKGKTDPVQVYKVLSQKDKPVTIHRLSGLRADLVGRKVELAKLSKAAENLMKGRGSIFSICGTAGTGKSRLIEEFKATLDLEKIQWIEGHAYAYSQNIPYSPLIDLLNRVLHIEENDPFEKVREKVESGIRRIVGKQEDIVPYVGGLYSLSYPEIENVSPEFWKSGLQSAIKAILIALANKAPTIYFLEDLHWADPSFVELLRQACLEIREPAIVLCVYRPGFSLFTGDLLRSVSKFYNEIQLLDLSRPEIQEMLGSLLKTNRVPSNLKRLVQNKAEGNPFYLEELVNSLIESESLIKDNGHWKIIKPIAELDISASIHGLISARIDHLENEGKRILQEASVIGRSFFYEILKRASDLKAQIDKYLSDLEQLDLIKVRTIQPELEYIFKHALTQEVVYSGLLKKERQKIHERIGNVIEIFFKDRLPEFYETIALHYSLGNSPIKAIDYLLKSGEKSLSRYAVEEAHQYYKEALDILVHKLPSSNEEKILLFEILIKWGYVYYYRGDFKGALELYLPYENMVRSLDDKRKIGMFYVWLGHFLFQREELKKSYYYLLEALKLGENTGDDLLIGYACTWLTWNCAELGKFDEGLTYGERAQKLLKEIRSDHLLFHESMAGIGQINWYMGKWKENIEIGKILLKYGKEHSNIRCLVAGYITLGHANFSTGDFQKAIEFYKTAISVAADPLYSEWGRAFLGAAYVQTGKFQDAEQALKEVLSFCQKYGYDYAGSGVKLFLAVVNISKGQIAKGIKSIEGYCQVFRQKEKKAALSIAEYLLGKIYSQIAEGGETINLTTLLKNIFFIIKNLPMAKKKAEIHLNTAIKISKDIGSLGIMGQAYLDLGMLYKVKGNTDQAKKNLSKAIQTFQQVENDSYVNIAKKAIFSP